MHAGCREVLNKYLGLEPIIAGEEGRATVVQPGFATIEAVQVVNPTTIRVSTKRPDPLLLVRMAQMGSQILPARLTTKLS